MSTLWVWCPEGQWIAEVFGANPAAFVFNNFNQVKVFADLMSMGNDGNLIQAFSFIFRGNTPGQVIYDTIFTETSEMCYVGEEFFQAGEETLSETLPEAGEWLLNFLWAGAAGARAIWRSYLIKQALHPDKTPMPAQLPKRAIKAKDDATEADWQMLFVNNSSDSFRLWNWACNLDIAVGTIVSQPTDLSQMGGESTLGWYQTMSSIAGGSTDGYVIFVSYSALWGIRIQAPFQMFTIGGAPYYQVTMDGGGTWSDEYHSESYTFPSSVGYKITVSPTAGHSTLSLMVFVEDLPPEKASTIKKMKTRTAQITQDGKFCHNGKLGQNGNIGHIE